MKINQFHRTGKKGFTLIELMVVIAILATMAGVAYPSYLAYINSSKKTVCIGNLKEIYGYGKMYADDNAGILPCSGMADNPKTKNLDESQGWWVALVPYIYSSQADQPASKKDPVSLPKFFACKGDSRLSQFGEIEDAGPDTISYASWTDNSAGKNNIKSPIQISRGQMLSGLPWISDGLPSRDFSIRTEGDFNERVLPDSEMERHSGSVVVLYADGAVKVVDDATFKKVAPTLAGQY